MSNLLKFEVRIRFEVMQFIYFQLIDVQSLCLFSVSLASARWGAHCRGNSLQLHVCNEALGEKDIFKGDSNSGGPTLTHFF